jgi:hypothetical protein
MQPIMIRLAALGAALMITAAVIVIAEMGGLYVTHRAEVAGRPAPKPTEVIINLNTPRPVPAQGANAGH